MVGVLPAGEKVPLGRCSRGCCSSPATTRRPRSPSTTPARCRGFVQRMNDEAERLGLDCTRFTTPHGLEDEGNYSCPRDLADAGPRRPRQRRGSPRSRAATASACRFPVEGGVLELYNNNPFIRAGDPTITGAEDRLHRRRRPLLRDHRRARRPRARRRPARLARPARAGPEAARARRGSAVSDAGRSARVAAVARSRPTTVRSCRCPRRPMPLRFDGGWRKRWRCDRRVRRGADRLRGTRPGRRRWARRFWAILDRASGELLERTRMRMPGRARRGLERGLGGGGLGARLRRARRDHADRLRARSARQAPRSARATWAECVCPNGEGAYVWTRKRVAPDRRATSRLPGGRRIRETMRGDRGRVGRLPPPAHGLVLVGRRRDARPTAGSSAGTSSRASTTRRRAQRAGDLGRRRGVPREPGPVELRRPRRRSPSRTARGSTSGPRPSAPSARTSSSSATATASRSAPSAARSTGSSSPRASA